MAIYPRSFFAAVLVFFTLASHTVNAVPTPPVAADANGDPLPPGAIARLGTLRLRHNCTALAWAPDSQTLVSAGSDGAIRIWDAASGKQVRQCAAYGNVIPQTLIYMPDGKNFTAASGIGAIRIWDAASGREIRTLARPQQQQQQSAGLALGAEEDSLIELCSDNTLHFWDMATGRENSRLELSRGKPQARIVLSGNGKRVASWTMPDVLTTWDASTGKELCTLATKLPNGFSLAISDDGKVVAASSSTGAVVLWDADSGKELHRFEGAGALQGLTFSPNGKTIAGFGADHAPRLWSLETEKELQPLETPASSGLVVFGNRILAFSPDGKMLAASQGTAIRLWSVETGKLLQRFTGHTIAVEDVRFSADGQRLVSCGGDGVARLWDLRGSKEIAAWTNPYGTPASTIAAPDGESVLAAAFGEWSRFKLGEDKPKEAPPVGRARGNIGNARPALSADGKTLVWMVFGQSIHLWDVDKEKEKKSLPAPANFYGTLALSPDGLLLATGGGNSATRLWDVSSAKEVRSFGDASGTGQFRTNSGLAFSPDGRGLLDIDSSRLIVYEVSTGGERLHILQPGGFGGYPGPSSDGTITRAVFSPDGETIAAGTFGGAIILLSTVNGRERKRLTGQPNTVTSLAFAPDGGTLAAGYTDGIVLVWDVKEWSARPAGAEIKPEKLAALWESLNDSDASKAYKAVTVLASAPDRIAAFLKGKLVETDVRFVQWIKDLNSDKLEVREKAEKELEKADGSAPALRKALESNPSAESRLLMQALLNRQKDSAKATEDIRAGRALEALERAGSADAISVMEFLTKDGPTETVKLEAKAALVRLKRRAVVR